MSGEEERLYARAEMLDETGELAQAVAEVLTGAQGAGVDPRAVISLTAALQTLDPGASTGYDRGQPEGPAGRLRVRLRRRVPRGAVRRRGPGPRAPARGEGTPGTGVPGPGPRGAGPRAGPPRPGSGEGGPGRRLRHAHQAPCDGCHSARAAAIAAAEAAIAEAEARIADAERRIGICEAAADILDPLAERLARALARLRTVPQDLGEVYELIYEFVRSGGKLPRYARWIEGEGAHV